MKIYIIQILTFILFTTLAYSELFDINLIGGTELNGNGCVCHTTERDTSVSVWIEGPDTLVAGQTSMYKMYLANGPAEAGGYNVAGRFGIMSLVDTLSVWHYLAPNELTQAFPLIFPNPQDTIYWEFAYTAPDSVLIDTLYSCGLSLVYDSIPDFHDRWNFGPKFPIVIKEEIVPVEFISFTSSINRNNVTLSWATATETNNMGFNVERKQVSSFQSLIGKEEWNIISFVNGNGTTTEKHTYSYQDENLSAGKYQYRLKQIDFDGTIIYSAIIEAEVTSVSEFNLEQNYPNPFNPITKISWQSPLDIWQSIKVYDVLGNEVEVLVDEFKSAGKYDVEFNSQNLSSGIYFYKLRIGKNELVKKMILLR